jgi:hypothetical protein
MPQTPPRPYQLLACLVLFALVAAVLLLLLTDSAPAGKFMVTENQPQVVRYQDYTLSPFYVPYSGSWGYRPSVYYPGYSFTGVTVDIGIGPVVVGVNRRWTYPWGGVGGSPWGYSSINLPNLYWRPYYMGSPWRSPYRSWGPWRPGQGYLVAGKPAWGRQLWRGTRGGRKRDFISTQPNLAHRPGMANQLDGRPVIVSKPPPGQGLVPPRTAARLPATRPAGAAWAKPWREGGPVVMDTHRAARPVIRVVPPPSAGSPGRLDVSRRTSPPVTVDDNRSSSWYRGAPQARKYYRYRKVDPWTGGYFKRFGGREFRGGIPAGRGYISAGRGFKGGHGRGGFRGGGFRGR